MSFSGLNYVAVFWAAVAGFLFGGVWYGALSKPWLAAVGITEEQLKGRPNAVPFLAAFCGMLVIGFILAALMRSLGSVGLTNGAMLGVVICAGFVLSTLVINHSFQNARRSLTLIDGGHWLGVFAVQGGVLGWFG